VGAALLKVLPISGIVVMVIPQVLLMYSVPQPFSFSSFHIRELHSLLTLEHQKDCAGLKAKVLTTVPDVL
jgi:hypothetical protein